MHKDRCKDVGSFEDDMYTVMLEDSSKFFTEAKDIGNRDEDIFLTPRPLSGFMIKVSGFFPVSLIIQSG